MPEFVHLHVHTEFSLLDSSIRVKRLVSRTAELGMRAVGVMDHGVMFGAVQLVRAAKDANVSPILGCEVNLVEGDRRDSKPRAHSHLGLIARSQEGYANLVRIVSLGWVDGMQNGVPRIDFELLRQYGKGLVCLTGCLGGVLPQSILHRGPEGGDAMLGQLRDCFEPDALFVELQDHGFVEQRAVNRFLVELAKRHGVPIVATNGAHYLKRDDARPQRVLQCIAAGVSVDEMERSHHGSDQIYLKSPEEMAQLFAELPEACTSTLRIAEMAGGVATPLAKPRLPRFPVPEGSNEPDHFRHLAEQGLAARIAEQRELGHTIDEDAYRARLAMECDVVSRMGFAGYFLIVQDFINWAKAHGVPVGPGRGSGAGSIAAWSLRITDLDPIPYGLLFERFLNPERVSMPDFDIDFCMDERDRVIDYVRHKYGTTSVGQIATFHQLKSRSVVRDVGRVLGWTPQDAGRIATMIPEPIQGKSVPIYKALEEEKQLSALYESDPRVKELIDTAQSLEDLTRHAGMHAAGIVISEGALWDHVPVFCPEENIYVTQFHKDDVESAGLVKFDFLGLKTLTVIEIAVKLINKRPDRKDRPFRIDRIALNDAATFALLQSGETTNVFQLESSGMQDLFKKLKPDAFEDIIAAISLYRPGPMELIPDFIARKHGKAKIVYPHPSLAAILKETYGVIVYQEQVMQAAQAMGGYTLGGADLLRRAMGKKKVEEMAKQKDTFIEGASQKGYAKDDAARVFDLIEKFAGYGFNKSHAAAYALIAYQTAYLKAHYPVEFTSATLSADKDKIEKVVRTVAEARDMGIVVLPPDVNESAFDFTVVYAAEPDAGVKRRRDQPVCFGRKVRDPYSPAIRFGLGAVKGMGESALEAVLEARRTKENGEKAPDGAERPFRDIFDFAERVDLRRVNKGVVEAMVQCGGFDSVHKPKGISRAQAFATIDTALERGRRRAQEIVSGQTSLFGLLAASSPAEAAAAERSHTSFANIEPWDTHDTLTREKATLGFYVSGHPLDRYAQEMRYLCDQTTATIPNASDGQKIRVAGMVEGYRERPIKPKNGASTPPAGASTPKIAFFFIEDAVGRVEAIVRPKLLDGMRETLVAGLPIIVSGVVQFEEGRAAKAIDDEGNEIAMSEAKILVDEVAPLAATVRARTKSVRVRIPVDRAAKEKLVALRQALTAHPGPCPVTIEIMQPDNWAVALESTGLMVEPSEALLSQLERLFGEKVAELR